MPFFIIAFIFELSANPIAANIFAPGIAKLVILVAKTILNAKTIKGRLNCVTEGKNIAYNILITAADAAGIPNAPVKPINIANNHPHDEIEKIISIGLQNHLQTVPNQA